MIEAEGARLLREKRVEGRPHRHKSAEEATGPPAESECLERKSTSKLCTYKKTVGKLDFSSRLPTRLKLTSNMMSAFILENINYLKKDCKCCEEKQWQ